MNYDFDQGRRSVLAECVAVKAWCYLGIGFAGFVATVAVLSAVSGVVL